MPATVVRRTAARVSETPNALMTTLASPSLSGTTTVSMWRVEMSAGQVGPVHSFDVEQVWTVLAGTPTITVDGESIGLEAGDTIHLPAEAVRQVRAQDGATFLVTGPATARATALDGPLAGAAPGVPPWIV